VVEQDTSDSNNQSVSAVRKRALRAEGAQESLYVPAVLEGRLQAQAAAGQEAGRRRQVVIGLSRLAVKTVADCFLPSFPQLKARRGSSSTGAGTSRWTSS
jgi:hypothetical protein